MREIGGVFELGHAMLFVYRFSGLHEVYFVRLVQ